MSDDPLIGSILSDRYRIDRLIGEGAMGRVYQAEHILMRKRVALKVLHPELMTVQEVTQRFEREARAAAQIEHPHVAGATDFGKLSDGGIYLVLELIDGVPLSELIEKGPLKFDRVLNIASQVCSALEAAHGHGIVHRDLKPDNLLLVQTEDGKDFIKVLDFGIAKVPTEPHETGGRPITQVGMVYGTPEYMAPEQALGQDVDARADLYALGVVMFEMLTGRRPYVGPVASLLGQQLSVPLPDMATVAPVRVPVAVEELVRGLLSADATKRPSDTSAVLAQIEGLLLSASEGRLPLPSRSALSSAIFPEERREPSRAHLSPPVPERRGKGSRIGRVSRAALLALLFGAVGVVSAIFLVGAVVDKREQAVSPQEKLTEPAPPVLDVPDVEPDIEVKIARAREGGIPALEKLAADYPTEGLVRAELALALAKAERYEEAVDFSRLALALDPMLNESPKVAGALFRSAQSVKARSATFRLLQGPMGAAGVGIIYDLARTEGPSPRVRAQAEELLKDQEVRAAASPSLRLVLDLEVAKTCDEVSALVLRAALVGDKRALPHLKNLEVTTGCGAQKKDDCYPCLRGKTELDSAVRTIEQRVTLVEETADDAPSPDKEGTQPEEAVP